MNSYEILTGAGHIYIAAVGTTFPAVNATPGASWTDLGEFDDGVKVTLDQKINQHRTDNRTGPVKASREEETLTIEAKLAQTTLESLAKVLGVTLVDTPPGVGTIGTREVPLYRDVAVDEYALVFRGNSPYGDFPMQFQVPRAYFDGAIEGEYKKADHVLTPVQFVALEDLNAATAGDRYGKLIAQDAAAT